MQDFAIGCEVQVLNNTKVEESYVKSYICDWCNASSFLETASSFLSIGVRVLYNNVIQIKAVLKMKKTKNLNQIRE